MTATPSTRTAPTGALTPELLTALRAGYTMSPGDRACHNAVTNNEVNDLALNRAVVRGDDGHFSHRIKSQGITDQKKSGRCWIFAALNVLRPHLLREHGLEEFTFSSAYLQFWDKLEKSNLFLESVIELRAADYLDRDWEMVNKRSLEDGGWWNYLAGLVEKYGVVPLAAMPETHSSAHTATLNVILGRLLRRHAVRILGQHDQGAGVEALRAAKNEVLREVWRFLVINFGEPPAEFDWRHLSTRQRQGNGADSATHPRTAAVEELTPLVRHTPHSFRAQYLGDALAGHVCLYNDPHNALDRHYRFDRTTNIVGHEFMHFVNIAMAPMKEIAVASILANEPLWFAVNMNFDESREHGLMAHRLFDYETLFGIDLTVSKADRTRFHAGASCHAMALMGVDLDQDGRPRKWLVENSKGSDPGTKGHWTLHDPWFDEHVYAIIVHRRHVPDGILQCFGQEPRELPAWYPGACGLRLPAGE